MKKKIYQTEHRPWPTKPYNGPLLPLRKKMIYTVLAVKDRAVDAFGRPIFAHTQGQAIRSFQDEINRTEPENNMNKHPDDYDLYLLGTFDDQSGDFIPNAEHEPKQIAIGKQMKIQKE